MCGCVLHNLYLKHMPLSTESKVVDQETVDHEIIPGSWRAMSRPLLGLPKEDGPVDDVEAVMLRKHLAKYYSSDELGALPWQNNVIFPQLSS